MTTSTPAALRCQGLNLLGESLLTYFQHMSILPPSLISSFLNHSLLSTSSPHFFFRNMLILLNVQYLPKVNT